MAKAIEKVGQSVAEIVASGIDMAMSKYNGKASDSI
jgi:hypothetical protein